MSQKRKPIYFLYLYLGLLAKHILADLFFQAMCPCGNKGDLRNPGLYMHSLQVSFLQLAIIPIYTYYTGYAIWAIIVATMLSFTIEFVAHSIIDFVKSSWRNRNQESMLKKSCRYMVNAMDQLAHISSLGACVLLVYVCGL